MEKVFQITDANINRVAEGLRVIEEYARFIWKNKTITDQLAALRKQINLTETHRREHLMCRDTSQDMRAKEPPATRPDLVHLLTANFKRVEEGLRVLEEYTGNPLYNQLRYDMYMLEKEILLSVEKPKMNPGYYVISDQVEVLERALKSGVSLVQLRDKHADKTTYFNNAKRLQPIAKTYKTPFIINDYLDIALLLNADGFHSGQDDLPVSEQRKLLGPDKLIGRTTHTLEQGLKAQAEGADYVSVGPIWETPSKPGRAGIGLDYLKEALTQLDIPYVAIGGINLDNIDEILAYKPPFIGLIRAEKDLDALKQRWNP